MGINAEYMGGIIIKKRTHLSMYRSLAAALLVAATQASSEYNVATGMASATASPKISASTCKITVTVATAVVTVVVAQTGTAAAAMTSGDKAELACSWQQAAAIWWVHVGEIEAASATNYKGKATVFKFVTAPAAANLTANSLFTGSATFTALTASFSTA